MLSRAYASGVSAQWVAGDTVYGYEELRGWLEEQQKNDVVAVPETHLVWMDGQHQPIGSLSALLPASAWVVLSSGEGSKGPRRDVWAWMQLPEQAEKKSEQTRWILIRRSLVDPSKRAYYRAAGPSSTTFARLVQVAGSRWKIARRL